MQWLTDKGDNTLSILAQDILYSTYAQPTLLWLCIYRFLHLEFLPGFLAIGELKAKLFKTQVKNLLCGEAFPDHTPPFTCLPQFIKLLTSSLLETY